MKRWLTVAAALVCVVAPSFADPAAATGSPTTPVWIGAPYAGRYGEVPHTPYSGNWALDLLVPTSTDTEAEAKATKVKLYVAPKDSRRKITAKVISVADSSCHAGKNVRIAIYDSGTEVGWISYTHVTTSLRATRTVHPEIKPWGGTVGTVWYARGSLDCWQVNNPSGAHVHIEARNSTGQSCYRGLSEGSTVGEHEYIGYLGRNDSGTCAAGA